MKYKAHFILEFDDEAMEYTCQPDPSAYIKAFIEDIADEGSVLIPQLEKFYFTGKLTKVN